MLDARIRRAERSDAEGVAGLAARSFRETFGAVNTAEDIALHIGRSFSRDLQAVEIASSETRTLLAEVDGRLAAFAQVSTSPAPECVRGQPRPVQLWRFYVDASWLGCGVARLLMGAVRAEVVSLGGETVWLGVWERNHRAIAFYVKWGFHDIGCHVFLLGNDVQTDRIMVRGVEPDDAQCGTGPSCARAD